MSEIINLELMKDILPTTYSTISKLLESLYTLSNKTILYDNVSCDSIIYNIFLPEEDSNTSFPSLVRCNFKYKDTSIIIIFFIYGLQYGKDDGTIFTKIYKNNIQEYNDAYFSFDEYTTKEKYISNIIDYHIKICKEIK